jgi:hypothetical protein
MPRLVPRTMSSLLRVAVSGRSMFVGKLTVLMSSRRVLLCLFMLSKIVMMGRLMVVMRGGVVVSCRMVVVLTGWVFLRHFSGSLRKNFSRTKSGKRTLVDYQFASEGSWKPNCVTF